MARPVPRKTSQRRQGVVLQNPQGKASRRYCAPDGGQLPLPGEGLLRRVLSAHAGQARHGPGDHRHRTQNRTNSLSRLIYEGTLHGNHLPPLRRTSPPASRNPPPQTGSSSRLSTRDDPGNRRITISSSGADLNEAALRRTHSRVAEPTVEVI